MTVFLENPLPIWSVGAVCFAISVIVFFAKRSLGSIIGMVGVIAVTLLLLFIERVVVTPSEQVEQSLTSLMDAIQANDLPAVISMIDPSAQHVRGDAETLMPQVKVKETGSTSVRVEVVESANPPKATAFFRGRIDGTHAKSGVRIFYFDNVEIDWQQVGDQWLIVEYRVKHRGKPIKPVEGFRTIR